MSDIASDAPTVAAPSEMPSSADVTPASLAALANAVEQIARSQQALLEAVRGSDARRPPDAPSSVSPDDVRRIVGELLDSRIAQQQRSAAREQYVRQNLNDLPDAYRRLMPSSGDPVELAKAEQDIRQQFRLDLRNVLDGNNASSAASPSVDAAGHHPGAAVDYSTLSPLQQIAVGLKSSTIAPSLRPGQPPPNSANAAQ